VAASDTTKLAVISDVHGNLAALEAVCADIRARGADHLINLGDCVSGPLWPKETCDYLQRMDIPTVRGNHDRAVGEGEPSQLGASDRFAFECLTQDQRDWLGALPATLEAGPGLAMFHATPHDDTSYLLEEVVGGRLVLASSAEISARLAPFDGRLAFCGHSHQPRAVRLPSGVLVVNPGSVGCPAYSDDRPPHVSETGSPHARYAMVTIRGQSTVIELVAVEYDWESAAAVAARNGRPSWSYALRTGYADPALP
jgi:predicted phosphodiesterase